jgi:1-acyl-sn-glycerol-3-phosphate acyltransferase
VTTTAERAVVTVASGRPSPLLMSTCRVLGRLVARSLFRIRTTGDRHVPRDGPVLLAGNHSGFLDGPLVYLLAPRPAAVLAKSELFVGGWPRLWRRLDVLPVHRGRADRAALRAGLTVLERGGALAVFPEGTRGSGELEEVADGLAWLALRSGAPVVPVVLNGTASAIPRGTWKPQLRAPVHIAYGRPLTVHVQGDPRARSTVRAAAEQLRLGMVAHLNDSREGHA